MKKKGGEKSMSIDSVGARLSVWQSEQFASIMVTDSQF